MRSVFTLAYPVSMLKVICYYGFKVCHPRYYGLWWACRMHKKALCKCRFSIKKRGGGAIIRIWDFDGGVVYRSLFCDMIGVIQYAVPIVSKDHNSIIFMDLDVWDECQAGLGGKMHWSRWWPRVAGWEVNGPIGEAKVESLVKNWLWWGWNSGAV